MNNDCTNNKNNRKNNSNSDCKNINCNGDHNFKENEEVNQ